MENQFLLQILFTFLIFIIIMVMLIKTSSPSRKKSIPISAPGPPKLPFIGNLHLMICSLPHHRLRDLANKYGPLMHLQLGEIPTIIVSSPQIATQVMKTHDINFSKRPHTLGSQLIFYDSTSVSMAPYGDYWRQMRKILAVELLSSKRVKQMSSIRKEEVLKFTKAISLKEGSKINLSEMLVCLTYDITTRVAIGGYSKEHNEFIPLIKEIVEVFGRVNVADMFPSVKLFQAISSMRPRLERLHGKVDRVLETIINECQNRKDSSSTENFLDTFLHLKEHGDFQFPLTFDNIKAVVLDIFLGGTETAATTVEWAMSELIRDKRVMNKAQAEVRELINRKGNVNVNNVNEEDIEEMEYLKLVIKETMRLHPPLPLLVPRESIERCEINGYEIAEKTRVIINAWAICRHPSYWNEPNKFYPERFVDSSIDYKGNNFEFIPFGAGRRICPGMSLGIINVELILAQLLYHFDWILPDNKKPDDLDMTEFFASATSRKHDLLLVPIIPSKMAY